MVDLKVWIIVVVLAGTAYGKFLIKKLIATYMHMIKTQFLIRIIMEYDLYVKEDFPDRSDQFV